MKRFRLAVLPALLLAASSGCSDDQGPRRARALAILPGAVLPRASFDEPARIPIAILVDCGDHAALALRTEARGGDVLIAARGREEPFDGGCLTDIDTILEDTVRVSALLLRDTTRVRFRQPGGGDSVRLIIRDAITAAP